MNNSKLFLHPQNKGFNLLPTKRQFKFSHTITFYPTELYFEQALYFLGDLFGQDPISNLLPIYKQLLWNNTTYLFATIALTTEWFPAQGWILTITTNSSYTDNGHTRRENPSYGKKQQSWILLLAVPGESKTTQITSAMIAVNQPTGTLKIITSSKYFLILLFKQNNLPLQTNFLSITFFPILSILLKNFIASLTRCKIFSCKNIKASVPLIRTTSLIILNATLT